MICTVFIMEQEGLLKKPRTQGRIYVAKYYPGRAMPKTADDTVTNILIHSSDKGIGGPLSPYHLRDESGNLLENIWQFAKVYPSVTKQRIPLGKYHPNTIVWEHDAELHVDPLTNQVLPAYWEWRRKGTSNKYAVRYPNGYQGRHKCAFSIWNGDRLDYIEARKRIYCGEYIRLAPKTASFQEIKSYVEAGRSIQIVEVDGPDPTLTYPPYDKISKEEPGMLMDEETIRLLINDPKKPFGHGFVIAALLLDGQDWLR